MQKGKQCRAGIYQDSKFLVPVVYCTEPVETSLWDISAEEYALSVANFTAQWDQNYSEGAFQICCRFFFLNFLVIVCFFKFIDGLACIF